MKITQALARSRLHELKAWKKALFGKFTQGETISVPLRENANTVGSWLSSECTVLSSFLRQIAFIPSFFANEHFTGKATFTKNGIFNLHSPHMWGNSNLYATNPSAFQKWFSVNVWAGIVKHFLIGSYLITSTLRQNVSNLF